MWFAPFEWVLALRYLRARRKESFISVISGFSLVGIALGVATLIIVMAVMNGFRIELLGKILGLNGHIMVQSLDERGLTGFDATAERLREIDGIMRVSPMIEGQVMASAQNTSNGALIRGMREADLKSLDVVAEGLVVGSLDNFAASGGVAIGVRMAQNMRLGVGDNITLISPRGAVTPFGVTPRIKAYPVTAIFEIGMSDYDGSIIFMPLEQAQLYFNKPNAVTALEIMVKDPDRVADWQGAVRAQVYQPASVRGWPRFNPTFFEALQVERNVMFLILTLIILVAALNIISGLIMLVKDKGHDIAILRSMGATKGAIMRVFFITGSSIGLVGTLLGLGLGVLFCSNIENIRQFVSWMVGQELFAPEVYFLSTMPAEMQTSEVTTVVIMALSVSFLATLYPSWRAARLDPVEALRYE